jgi:hypothetical protein
MPKDKAIIIAANLKGDFLPEYKNVGNVLAHASHIEKEGAVLWSIVKPSQRNGKSFPHHEIKRGYFYNVTDKAVTHVFDIEYCNTADQLRENKRKVQRYLIDSRKPVWKNQRDKFYWMKIKGIYRLKREHPLRDFKKYEDQKPLSNCRNYAIIIDYHFKHHNDKITRREIMSDYIGDLLSAGKVTEKDIEELFSYRLADKMSLIERQGSFQKAGRLDLLYRNRLGRYILYELKKGTAKLPALDQIKRYMKFWTKKYKIKAQNMTGIILAKSIDPDLYKALSRATNIESRTYFFSVELK